MMSQRSFTMQDSLKGGANIRISDSFDIELDAHWDLAGHGSVTSLTFSGSW